MKPHSLTFNFVQSALEQPAISAPGNDLAALEHQIHGFDEALMAMGQLQSFERFNRVFSRFVASKLGHSSS